VSLRPSAAGKGDQPRPTLADSKTVKKNWDAINWGKAPKKGKKSESENHPKKK